MAAKLFEDKVKDTSTTTGLGSFTLSGTSPSGFRTFNAAYGIGTNFDYAISNGAEWEVGVGTLSAATTLVRTTVTRSSNANGPVNFSAGTKIVISPLSASSILFNTSDTAAANSIVIADGAVSTRVKNSTATIDASNNLLLTGSLGLTGSRIIKGWFTDLDVVNTITGNATTASTLQTGRSINGVSFNGSSNITVPAAADTLTNTTLASNVTASSLVSFGVSPNINTATATSINKVAITAPTTSATLTIANLKTLTVNNSITLAGTDATVMTFPTTTATIARIDASQTFAGTQTFTNQIQGSISGSAGSVATVPALSGNVTTTGSTNVTTIAAGAVTNAMLAGSIASSKLVGTDIATVGTITAGTWNAAIVNSSYGGTGVNNSGRTLTILGNSGTLYFVNASKTLGVYNNLYFQGPDNNTYNFPATAGNIGYLEMPQNSQSASYTLVIGDSGKHIFHPSFDTTPRTYTIPSNSSVAFPIGTAVTFINASGAGVVTISITTDTLRLAGPGTTGNRTLAANGIATAIKVGTTEWVISGSGLT
jgi:hypothetical protein